MSSGKRQRSDQGSPNGGPPGIFNERLLVLVFEAINWDLRSVCATASVNRKLRAIAKRRLWRQLCANRAPRMLSALTSNGAPSNSIFEGEWHSLAKLMFFCCGCNESTRNFLLTRPAPGHFLKSSRFSKTSGRSFLAKKCRGDLLYVSDPCEHPMGEDEDDLGVYRGVFRGFMRSRTRACLIRKRVELEKRVRCPYCGTRVWSMTTARLVPKSAARRLGSIDGRLEYFVCLNGHLHGSCWLAPLSSDERGAEDEDEDADEDEDEDEDDSNDAEFDDGDNDDSTAVNNGSASSAGEEVAADGSTTTSLVRWN